MQRRSLRLWACGLGAVAAVAVFTACGDDSSGARPDPSTVPSTTTSTTAPSPPTTFPSDQADALRDVVIDFMEDRGFGASFFLVRNLLQSPADPTWARFNVAPTLGNETVVDSQYGVAHMDGSQWTVVALGIEDVGCGDDVPAAVRDSLQLGCSPG